MSRLCCCFPRGGSPERASKVSSSNGDALNVNLEKANRKDAKVADETKKVASSTPKPSKTSEGAVLVELFTSQGCSSCPPADLLISKLGQGDSNDMATDVPIVVLAYHVDYWDYAGWKDPFASSLWSVRQRAYGQALQQDSIYTPEVVVQGRSHCIGSNAGSISSLIKSAPRYPVPDIHVSFTRPSPSVLEVLLNATLKFKVEGFNLDVLVALFENGHVTDCTKGENRGRVLTNDFVVRSLEKACTVHDLPAKKSVKGQVSFKLWESYSKVKCGIAVFFQNPSSLEVYGAHLLELPDDA